MKVLKIKEWLYIKLATARSSDDRIKRIVSDSGKVYYVQTSTKLDADALIKRIEKYT